MLKSPHKTISARIVTVETEGGGCWSVSSVVSGGGQGRTGTVMTEASPLLCGPARAERGTKLNERRREWKIV